MSRKTVLLGPYPPPYGGVSIYVQTLFEFLKNRGIELWTYGDKEVSATNVFFMKDKRWELVPLLVRRGSKARIADCTHFLMEYPSVLVPLWVALKYLLGFQWLKILQDGSLPSRYQDFGLFRRALLRMAANSVTEFIVISNELEQWLRHEIRVRQPVTRIKSLFPVAYRESHISLSQEMEPAFGAYQQHRRRVCSIGAFIPSYGFEHVAAAVERIRNETGENIGLLLLDGDFAGDENYRSRVVAEREWITVLKNVAHPFVFQILRSSDVFVRAFGLESYGLSRVEAIWSGLPVVATRAGETRGMLLYDFGNVDQLATQLKAALFTEQSKDVSYWATVYQQEAEENLAMLVRKIGT